MPIVYLIRHGEPELTGVFLGRMNPPLSAAGRISIASSLADLSVSIVYSSPLLRARQTAEYITGADIIESSGLQEIDFGVWTGKSWSEIEAQWADLARRKSEDWLGIDPPGAENWSDLVLRLRPICQRIRSGPMPAAVVAHQAVNAALANLLAGSNPLSFTQRYGEVIPLELD